MEKTTNMEKIRELALKHFDAFDISVEPRDGGPMEIDGQPLAVMEPRCLLNHPYFWSNLFAQADPDANVALYKVIGDPVAFEQRKTKIINATRTILSEVNDPMDIFFVLQGKNKMPFIKEIAQFLSPSDCSRVLREVVTSGIPSAGIAIPLSEFVQFKTDILELFEGSFIRQDFMHKLEQERYDSLPDVVTVYHGVSEETKEYEVSDIFYWTPEIKNLVPTENFGPHESDDGIVYEATIKKEDIYGYLVLDDTVFLNPDKLFNILHHTNFPLDDIELDEDMEEFRR